MISQSFSLRALSFSTPVLKMLASIRELLLVVCILFSLLLHSRLVHLVAASSVPALFVFGDSLVDPGNNNMLLTRARADHPPYGHSFDNQEATGRFSDGKLIPDFLANVIRHLASYLGLPFPPPYLQARENILQGVNFGSASSGLFRWIGVGDVMSLSDQVDGFRDVHYRLVRKLGSRKGLALISNSIFYICTANNDVNFFVHQFLSFGLSRQGRDALLLEFARQMQRLYSLGARKFVIVGLSAVGCIPMNQIWGRCSEIGVGASFYYNLGLSTLVSNLRAAFQGAEIVVADFQGLMIEVKANPRAFGFRNAVVGCCPLNQPWRWCYDGGSFCNNASEFMYWDMIHPTEAFNRIAAERWWNGSTPDVSPMNIRQLADVAMS